MPEAINDTPLLLIVDDDPGDLELTKRAIADTGIRCDVRTAADGEEARDYVLNRGPFRDPARYPTPDLILLDLNMPRMDGREFLAALHRDVPNSEHIVVVVFSTSAHPDEILNCISMGAKSYLVKPHDINELDDLMRRVLEYWVACDRIPGGNHMNQEVFP